MNALQFPPDHERTDPEPAIAAGGLRTTLSLLILFHLFALATALLANDPGSALARSMSRVTRPYLDVMNLNVSFRYPWTLGEEIDLDYQFEVQVAREGGQSETVTVPAANDGLMQRQRMSVLANWGAQQAIFARIQQTDSSEEGLTAAMVGRWVAQRENATSATIRCFAKPLPERDKVRDGKWDVAPVTVYQGYLRRDRRGQWGLAKASSRGESAPAEQKAPAQKTPAPNNSSQSTPEGTKNPATSSPRSINPLFNREGEATGPKPEQDIP